MQYLPLVGTYADFNMEMSFAFKIKQTACYNTYTHIQSIQNICYYNNMVRCCCTFTGVKAYLDINLEKLA